MTGRLGYVIRVARCVIDSDVKVIGLTNSSSALSESAWRLH